MDVRIIEANSHIGLAHQMLIEVIQDEDTSCEDMRTADLCLYSLGHALDLIEDERTQD